MNLSQELPKAIKKYRHLHYDITVAKLHLRSSNENNFLARVTLTVLEGLSANELELPDLASPLEKKILSQKHFRTFPPLIIHSLSSFFLQNLNCTNVLYTCSTTLCLPCTYT